VAGAIAGTGGHIARAELVGLVPAAVLRAEPQERWEALGLSAQSAIEVRLAALAAGRATI